MIKKLKYFSLIGIFTFLVFSCDSPVSEIKKTAVDKYTPEYAKFFKIDYYNHYKKISILNPFGNKSMDLEYLIATDSLADFSKEKASAFRIISKPKKIIALSSPIIGLINILELDKKVVGLTDPDLIYDSATKVHIKSGNITNIGKSIQVNMEKLIVLDPDLIIGSGWDEMSSDYERMITLKMIPLLMYDWQEKHPLGKAEWMVLLGSFFNEEEQAIEQFGHIKQNYTKLKQDVADKKQPVVFNGSEYQGIWYSAGGKSYMTQFYKDAGGTYLLEDNEAQGSITFDFEVLMHKASNADIWMYTGGVGQESIQLINSTKYQYFKAVKTGEIYSYHGRQNAMGANDYWETGGWRPDIVLHDLINIFHQKAESDLELYYFKKVTF